MQTKYDLLAHSTSTHTHLTALFPGLPRWAGTRKVKPIWILLKQETVSGSGISWATCKSAARPRQITTPAPHHSVFYRPDALPAAEPTASKHWRPTVLLGEKNYIHTLPYNRFSQCTFSECTTSETKILTTTTMQRVYILHAVHAAFKLPQYQCAATASVKSNYSSAVLS